MYRINGGRESGEAHTSSRLRLLGFRHRHIAFEVEGDATVQQFKRKLDAAGGANILMNLGAFLSLRFNDPNGLILEFMVKVGRSFEYERTSRASAHSELQQWLQYRQNWWRTSRNEIGHSA